MKEDHDSWKLDFGSGLTIDEQKATEMHPRASIIYNMDSDTIRMKGKFIGNLTA